MTDKADTPVEEEEETPSKEKEDTSKNEGSPKEGAKYDGGAIPK
jgi:hypothetical protein